MALSNGTCYTAATIKPNQTELRAIKTCQQFAERAYCYPPNGTRICVPSGNIPFYWAPQYYHEDAIISIEFDLDSSITFFGNNTGNRTDYYTPYMYETGLSIPGVVGERRLPMYFLERRIDNPGLDTFNLEVHDGPEIVLVKTAEFTTTTWNPRTSATATATGSPSSGDFDDGKPRLSSMAAAGIVVGILVTVTIAVCFCCCACRRKKEREENGIPRTQENRVWLAQVEHMRSRPSGPPFILSRPRQSGEGVGGETNPVFARDGEGDDVVTVPPPPYTSNDPNTPPKYRP